MVLLAVTVFPRVGGPAPPPEPDYWPTDGWRTSTPEEHGFDSAKLAEALLTMREKGLDIHSLMVIRDGYVLTEAYFYPYDGQAIHDLASVTKSVTAALVGVAVAQGHLGLDDPMLSFFPDLTVANVDALKERITVRHLVGMVNGMESAGMEGNERTDQEMKATGDWAQFALDRKMAAEPGERFVYDSPGLHLLSPILEAATGRTEVEFARENLFAPLGIREVLWLEDPQGHNTGAGDLFMHPRDAAKIGLLWLQRGKWEGNQIVPSNWVRDTVTAHATTGMPEDYGYGWWVSTSDDFGGSYMATGRGGQRILVLPALNLIVVTTASMDDPAEATNLLAPAAVSPEEPLPPNPAGVAQLQAAVASVLNPPAAQPTPPLPDMAEIISGRTYALEPNPLALATVRLTFDGTAEAWLDITKANDEPAQSGPVGLDGLYRFWPGEQGLPAGLRGSWSDDETFVVEYDMIAFNHAFILSWRFEGEGLTLEARERTEAESAVIAGWLEE
jgi:CubicO group peptidase (beta-lactamase class C family)